MGHNDAKKLEFNYNDGTILADNNAITFYTNNTQRMKMNSAGDIVIGDCRLHYVGHSTEWYTGFANKFVTNDGTGYCLLQHRNGETFLNTAGGEIMHFREANSDKNVS